jgi:hypothetical protein
MQVIEGFLEPPVHQPGGFLRFGTSQPACASRDVSLPAVLELPRSFLHATSTRAYTQRPSGLETLVPDSLRRAVHFSLAHPKQPYTQSHAGSNPAACSSVQAWPTGKALVSRTNHRGFFTRARELSCPSHSRFLRPSEAALHAQAIRVRVPSPAQAGVV